MPIPHLLRSHPVLTAAAVIALFCVACSNEAPVGPDDLADVSGFRRVELTTTGPDAHTPRQLSELRPSAGSAPWEANADRSGLTTIEGAQRDGRSVPATFLERDDGVAWVRGPIPESARGCTTVIVEAASIGHRVDVVRLYLYENGERVGAPRLRNMARHDRLQAFSFDIPNIRGAETDPTEFGVAFGARNPRALLASVSFVEMPTQTFAPSLTGDGGMVRVGDGLERAIGMIAGHTVTGEFEVSGDDTFRVAFAMHPGLQRKRDRISFDVRIEGTNGPIERTIRAKNGASWKEIKLRGMQIGVGPAKLTVRMTSEPDEHSVGLMTIPTLRRTTSREGDRKPHTVILITSDTHRADHLGIVGPDAPVSTPNLDRLARSGVRFTNCASLTNVTVPSHISLMTGLHPRDVGVLSNVDRLVDSANTLAEAFRAAGYETFGATSAPNLADQSGLGQGFDKMNGPTTGQRPGTVAIDHIVDWLDDAGQADVFAWLHVYDAHAPYSPPAPYKRRYYKGNPYKGDPLPLDDTTFPTWAKRVRDIDFPYAEYRAEVDFVDGSLEKVLDHPRAKDAIIAFTSDHGELFGEQGVWWSHSGLFPGTLRIPLIMDWPGAPEGVVSDVPVQLTDVGRTILDLANVEGGLEGRNLMEMVEDPPPAEPRFALSAHHHEASLESDGWFLRLDLNEHKGPGMTIQRHVGETQLFHIAEDPDCENDLLVEEFDRALRMREVLMEWLLTAPTDRLSEGRQRTDAETAMLAELGYGGDGQADASEKYWSPAARIGEKKWQRSVWRKLFEDDSYGIVDFRAETGR